MVLIRLCICCFNHSIGDEMKYTGPWRWVTSTDREGLLLVDSRDYVVLGCDDFFSGEELHLVKAAPVMQKALQDIAKVLRFYVRHEQQMRSDVMSDLIQMSASALAAAEGWE